ncbi:MAG TPA: YIP1 family protein [Candidatus Udaeobacter sp.]|nr:YIP1 family protein [Candidatus Udaeobacter sp.]
MATVHSPVAEPQAGISPFGRIIGVFFAPKATFEDIVRRPNWLLPTVLILLMSLAAIIALNSHFSWRDYISQQIEKSPRAAQLSAEAKERQVEMSAKYSPAVAYVFGLVLPICGILVIALVLWGAFSIMAGTGTNYKTALAIVSHAIVPASVVSTILFVTVLFLKPVGMFDLDNPVATNVAALLADDASKWLVALCKNLDLLELWKLVLLSIGFAAISPKKLHGGKAFSIVFGVFLVYLVLRVGIAFAFS